MTRLLALLLALIWTFPATAQDRAGERILRYDVDIAIQSDGSLDITETIAVRAEGRRIRRGITREFPTRYRDRYGDRVVVDFQVLDVQRNGRPEPWFTEPSGNGVRINTGNDDFLPVPAEHIYTLRYRTTRQLGFFDAHDELYFNALGHGSVLAVERGSVSVRLPAPVPAADMDIDGFTGATGTRGKAFRASVPTPGVAHWELAAPLKPGEGLTVVVGFPKGIVAEPGWFQRVAWRLKDNRAGIVALVGFGLLLAYCIRRWRLIGRDPRPGTIIVRYEPPPDYSPAELRFMQRKGYDSTAFSSDLLVAAVNGAVTIHREERTLRADRWTVQPGEPGPSTLHPDAPPARLVEQLLPPGGKSLELHQENASRIQKAMAEHGKQLRSRIIPTLYRANHGSVGIAVLIAAIIVIGTVLAASLAGGGWVLAAPLLLATLVSTVIFGLVIGAPTADGRQLLDEIEGFKRYLSVAERQDLQQLRGPSEHEPSLDAGRFERLLPYAVALEVEEAWTRKFTAAAGAAAVAAATSAITWYSASGHGAGIGDIGGMTRALSKGLSSQIASSSSPPGSSSGGGGGGFSGGGGGGGGVGGR
ncbi:DUF2207 domain-containing protein [Luteimonas sp. A478]